MIYDLVLSTGDTSVSGCSSDILQTNTFTLFHNQAGTSQTRFYYDRNLSTGQSDLSPYLNGQNLFQEIPQVTQLSNEIVYTIETGDLFTKGSEASIYDRSELYFDSTTPANSASNISYNIITGGMFAGIGDSGLSLNSGISGEYSVSNFNDYHYFLNGIKVYSGDGVGITVGAGTTQGWQISFGVGATAVEGVVTNQNKNKFKYTAHRKRIRTTEATGRYPDNVYGSGFIETRNNFYVNGILQPEENYLELYTGVSLIKTGFDATISGGFPEPLSGSSYTL
jgi:hypothetical protein